MLERGYVEQARHYREAARDFGCTCPDTIRDDIPLPPHVHLIECPLYQVQATPAQLHQHLDQEHDADLGQPWL